MIRKTAKELEELLGGRRNGVPEDLEINGVSTDTRTLKPGNLFLPLRGENFDGHDYLKTALDKGAAAVLSEKDIDLPHIRVDDAKNALYVLAADRRKETGVRLIAITGSNGKTTTKDILYSILKQKYKVQRTPMNLNNEIGLSKTLLSLEDDTEYLVLEMGMEGFGEISLLTKIARPDIAVITNIGDSHLLQLKTKENIARAKLEILEGLKKGGAFWYNGDDEILMKVLPEFDLPENAVSYGTSKDADVVFTAIRQDERGTVFETKNARYRIPLLGEHQIYNGGLSAALAEKEGLTPEEIRQGLDHIEETGMRSTLRKKGSLTILDDSYKSNPQALRSCIRTATDLPGYDIKILVLGDMLELGADEKAIHRNIADLIDPEEIDAVVTVGELAYEIHKKLKDRFPENRLFHGKDYRDALKALERLPKKNVLIAVKGSRALQLDKVVEGLLKD